LGLKKEDVSHLASVSAKSVRYDEAIPEQVRERLEEVANTMNMVANAFGGDVQKTVTWFRTRNPLLGDVAPRDMIRLGRYERLRKFIINAMYERSEQRYQPLEST
jgi:Asp-tRNA(Asn)/Glu-tRNA(Gln) amidotransferase C subunit